MLRWVSPSPSGGVLHLHPDPGRGRTRPRRPGAVRSAGPRDREAGCRQQVEAGGRLEKEKPERGVGGCALTTRTAAHMPVCPTRCTCCMRTADGCFGAWAAAAQRILCILIVFEASDDEFPEVMLQVLFEVGISCLGTSEVPHGCLLERHPRLNVLLYCTSLSLRKDVPWFTM